MKKILLLLAAFSGLQHRMLIAGLMLPLSTWAGEVQSGAGDRSKTAPENASKSMLKVAQGTGTEGEKAAGESELSPMVVRGIEGEQPVYQLDESTAGTKFPLEITRVPQSIQVITSDAFEDQGAQSIGDIMKQVPSANLFGSRFSRFPGITVRGFRTDQTRNGIRQLFFSDTDFSALSHIQSLEVLKGPGSTVFGQNGNGGGVLNIITKRPYDRLGAEVSFTRGGWTGFDGDITSGQWDVNAPLTSGGALKMRFTGEVERTDSFINFQDLNRENFGLALAYDNGGPLRGFVNAEYQNRRSLSNPGLPPLGTVQSSGVGRISRDTQLAEPRFDTLETDSPLVQSWLEIDVLENWNGIFKNWTLTPRFQYHEFNVDANQVFLGAASVDTVNRAINVERSGRSNFKERDQGYIGQIDLTGTMETGPLTHQIYLGGDYTNWSLGGDWLGRSNVPAINALDPAFLNAPLETNPDPLRFAGNWQVWAFAFQDVVSITPYFDLLGGVRHSIVTGQRTIITGATAETDTTNTSFQLGGTLHVSDSVHLFAGFGEGFNVADAVGFGTADGTPFKLGESEQVEAGVKVNFPWGLSGTLSFFDITRTNVTTPDRENPGFSVQTGEVDSKGAELELAYQVTRQWYLQGGYAYIDAEIAQSNAGDVGNRFQNTPEHQANLWSHYRFDSGLLRNLTLSAGARFVGDRPLDNANTVDLPNYTIVDLGASYTYKNVKLELFANNLLDERYFTAADFGPAVFPGLPRSIVGRISLKY